MQNIQLLKNTYDKYQNLKLAANELGMKWQTLYWNLKKHNHNIIGNKELYGTDRDKFARLAELDFIKLFPMAKDMNRHVFQSKYDFEINGYKIDLKASHINQYGGCKRWAFSLKKQNLIADFFVCFAYENNQIKYIFLLPKEIVKDFKNISVSYNFTNKSKWFDYLISVEDLQEFFEELSTHNLLKK